MLPFMDKKRIAGIIISRKGKPDIEASAEVMAPEGDIAPELREAAMDMISALESKSPVALAKALKAAFEICDSYPHEEGEHLEEESE